MFGAISKVLVGLFFCTASFYANSAPLGALESPANGSIESGIGIVRGWHCTASVIEAYIDGVSIGKAYVGSSRMDTLSVCGKGDTGFSLLINYNQPSLVSGTHVIQVYGDGTLFGQANFNNMQSGGQEYLRGVQRQVVVPSFPDGKSAAVLTWREDKQNFVVTSFTLYSQAQTVSVSTVAVSTGADSITRGYYSVRNDTARNISRVDFDVYCLNGGAFPSYLKTVVYLPTQGLIAPGVTDASSFFYYSPASLSTTSPRCGSLGSDMTLVRSVIYDASGAIVQ